VSDLSIKVSVCIQCRPVCCLFDRHINNCSCLSSIAPLRGGIIRGQPTAVCAVNEASELAVKEELELAQLHLKVRRVVVSSFVGE
jgi:hypothetical protein